MRGDGLHELLLLPDKDLLDLPVSLLHQFIDLPPELHLLDEHERGDERDNERDNERDDDSGHNSLGLPIT